MSLEAQFEAAMADELYAILTEKMSAGDRSDCYAIELLFYPDQNPFDAQVDVLACSESVLRERPDFDPADLELRWNHAILHPEGDLASIPAADDTSKLKYAWQESLGAHPVWATDGYPVDGRDEYDRISEIVEADYRQILVRIVQALHRLGVVQSLFGREIPLFISTLCPDEAELLATVAANGANLSASFAEYLAGSADLTSAIKAADERFRIATGRS